MPTRKIALLQALRECENFIVDGVVLRDHPTEGECFEHDQANNTVSLYDTYWPGRDLIGVFKADQEIEIDTANGWSHICDLEGNSYDLIVVL